MIYKRYILCQAKGMGMGKEKRGYDPVTIKLTLYDILQKYPPINEKNCNMAFQELVKKFPELLNHEDFKPYYKPNVTVEGLFRGIVKHAKKEIKKEVKPKKKRNKKRGLKYLNSLLKFEEANKELLNCLIQHVNNGFNLQVLNKAMALIHKLWVERTGTANLTLNIKDKAGILKKTKGIKASFQHILNLKAVLEDFAVTGDINRTLKEIQAKIKDIQEEYINLLIYEAFLPELDKDIGGLSLFDYPQIKEKKLKAIIQAYPVEDIKRILKTKPCKQSSHIFKKPLQMLYKEFTRIYSDKKALKETQRLLNLLYPEIFKSKGITKLKKRLQKK